MKSTRTPSDAAAGFENAPEVLTPVPLLIQGSFPSWLSGSLYRIGPGTFRPAGLSGKQYDVQHWFDGLAMVHRFDVIPAADGSKPSVAYMCRRTSATRERKVIESGGWSDILTFGQTRDPCESYFQRFFTFFRALTGKDFAPPTDAVDEENVSVTLRPGMPGFESLAAVVSSHSVNAPGRPPFLVATTDGNRLQVLDADSLEPKRLVSYAHLDASLDGGMTAAHPCIDATTGDTYNFTLKLGPAAAYTVFRIHGQGERKGQVDVLARISDSPTAYLHSFFMTERYLVICIWQADIAMMGLPSLWYRNIVEAIGPWDPDRPTLYYVIDRNAGGIVAKYESPAFFAFHAINAYEEEDDIILDLIAYPDISAINATYLHNLRSKENKPTPEMLIGRARRYRLPTVSSPRTQLDARGRVPATAVREAEELFRLPQTECIELPSTSPAYAHRRYRYVWGISRAHPGSDYADQLIKLDMAAAATSAKRGSAEEVRGDAQFWVQDGTTPGEPIFVADPEGTAEDDGVVLSVVLDGKTGKGFLLCLDARNMRELGRAEMAGAFPQGFHGLWVG